MKKELTEKQLIKILTEILPDGYKKSVQVTSPNSESVKEVSATDQVLGRKGLLNWLNDKNKFHLSMDGAKGIIYNDRTYFWTLGI